MRKIKTISLALMIILLFTACTDMKNYDVYERVYSCYNSMHAYRAKVEVTSYSNNSENKYNLTQYYKAPDKHRSEYVSENGDSTVTIINGENGKLISDYSAEPVVLDKLDVEAKDYLMLNTFFDLYYSSEETAVKTGGNDKKGKITLSAETGSDNPYRERVELVIDSEALNPVKMTVYNNEGDPSVCVTYLSFELNPPLDDKIFE